MKLDEKYFIPFLVVVAIMAAVLIALFTANNRTEKEQAFKRSITAQDSLKLQFMPVVKSSDSLRVALYPDKFVVLDFWATWTASFSRGAHQQLAELKDLYPDNLEVLAAVVQDKPEKVEEYINRHKFPFHYVNGTKVFHRFNVGGVPTQLIYQPGGQLHSIFTGYADSTRMDSLKKIISNEQ